mgnify:FL=1
MAKTEVAVKAAPKKNVNKNNGKAPKASIIARLGGYFKGVKTELKRVVWPDREEVVNSSIVVIVTLVFFAVFSLIIDSGASSIIFALKKLVG